VPFSLMWGGFAIFWETLASGMWGAKSNSGPMNWFMMLWGIPFIVIGQYLIWGRFLTARWKKKRTYYALTNRRVIVVQNGWSRKMASAYVDTLPTIIKEKASNGLGTLRFAQRAPAWSNQRSYGAWDGMDVGDIPTFVDIPDVDMVYRMVSDQRERAADRSQAAL